MPGVANFTIDYYISMDGLKQISGQIEALMKTAVELHSRAIAQRQENRWWLPIISALAAAIFGFLGAIVGALLKS